MIIIQFTKYRYKIFIVLKAIQCFACILQDYVIARNIYVCVVFVAFSSYFHSRYSGQVIGKNGGNFIYLSGRKHVSKYDNEVSYAC